MQLRMQERRAIVVSRQGGDRVSALQVAAIALVGMCSGLVLVGATTRLREAERPRERIRHLQTESAIAAATAWQAAAAASGSSSKINVFAAAAVGGEPSLPIPGVATPLRAVAEPVLHAPAPAGHLERGRVVYLRCDGPRRRHRRAGCPHDRRLESAVWSVLEQLTQCPANLEDADLGRGLAALRLTLQHQGPTEVEFEASRRGPSMKTRAVSRCTVARLSELRARLRADHAVVVFHFRFV
jgi:hypothetical protein